MTDNELDSAQESQKARFVDFVRGADLLIHDSQYTEAEYRTHSGWGHSTWPKALELAVAGRVSKFVLFHHDPDHSDEEIDNIFEQCQSRLKKLGSDLKCLAAREGLEVLV